MAISEVNRTAIKSGLSLFLAGGAYVVIARRYSQISNCSTKAQLEAFAIVGIVQGSLATHFLTYKTSPSLKFFEFMVFTGIAVKKCGFEKPLLKIIIISFSALKVLDFLEVRESLSRERPQRPIDIPLDIEQIKRPTDTPPLLKRYWECRGLPIPTFENAWDLTIREGSGLKVILCSGPPGSKVNNRICGWPPFYEDKSRLNRLPWPDGYVVHNLNVDLSVWINLHELPEDLYIDGYLRLPCLCTCIFPKKLRVNGDLEAKGTIWLSEDKELFVGGNLNLQECRDLTFLPEKLYVGGDLNLEGCRRLTSLPDWITELGYRDDGEIREVNLTGTGLSDDIIDRLRDTAAPGMRFIFGREATAIDERTFSSLEQALSFWTALDRSARVPRLILQESDKADMVQFLGRLSNTAEYRNLQTRTILAKRILKMVSFLSENEETKAKAFEIIHEGLTSCDDRIIAALDDVELLEKIHAAEKDSPSVEAERKLRSLGVELYRLEEVRRHAAAHMRTLTWVDEVEVQLAFQIGLTKMLDLPLSTQNMLFRGCAGVSDEKIVATGQKVLRESTKERIDQFLACWDPWTRHNRRKDLLAYEELPLEATPTQGPVQCTVLQEEAAMPVRHGQNVFGYDAFCKVYVESGKDPCTNMPIDWSDVRRIRCS